MDIVARAREMVHDLTQHVKRLKDWQIDVAVHALPIGPDDIYVSAQVEFLHGWQQAKIFIDTRFGHWREFLTLKQVIAHECGHIYLYGTKADLDDEAADAVGALLYQWAAERANCKCGEST